MDGTLTLIFTISETIRGIKKFICSMIDYSALESNGLPPISTTLPCSEVKSLAKSSLCSSQRVNHFFRSTDLSFTVVSFHVAYAYV